MLMDSGMDPNSWGHALFTIHRPGEMGTETVEVNVYANIKPKNSSDPHLGEVTLNHSSPQRTPQEHRLSKCRVDLA